MKKYIPICVMFFSLHSTQIRVQTLGGILDWVDDNALITLYPSRLLDFSQILFLEVLDTTINSLEKGSFGGINTNIGEEGRFGTISLYLNYPIFKHPFSEGYPTLSDRTLRGINISYAKNTGEKVDVGLGIGFARISEKEEDTTNMEVSIARSLYISLLPGVSYRISEDKAVDISLQYINHNFYQETPTPGGVDTLESTGTSSFGGNVRYVTRVNEFSTGIVGFHYYGWNKSFRWFSGTNYNIISDKINEFDFNLGLWSEPLEHLNLLIGLNTFGVMQEITDSSQAGTKESSYQEISINGIIGTEVELTAPGDFGVIFRTAFRKPLFKNKNDTYTGNPSRKSEIFTQETFNFFLGLGLQKGNLKIDGLLAPDLFRNGPYLITGETSNFFSAFSLLYNFSLF